MIADKTRTQVQSTVTGEKVRMSFDEDSITHLMGILTDLYSDPEAAVIREYATNARDSHLEAGQTRPIEVYLPSTFSPLLRIKDFGTGLSGDDIKQIYSKYGASTKRETNDQVGMLGLGCKSALTYAPQFTLTGVKDGVRTEVSISRDETGAGHMTIVSETETDEPNGVEVTITAKRHNQLEAKAYNFFKYWPKGSVLVNGKEPKHLDGLWLNDKFCVTTTDEYRYSYNPLTSYIVMGGVAYPVESQETDRYGDKAPIDFGLSPSSSLVAFVDIGDVAFTPSREALHYTPKTKATIARIKEEFAKVCEGAVQREIDKAPDRHSAIRTMYKWHTHLRPGVSMGKKGATYAYKGEDMPWEWRKHDDKNDYADRIKTTSNRSYVLSQESMEWAIPSSVWHSTVWVEDFTPVKLSPSQKKKMRKWVEDCDLEGVDQYVLLEGKLPKEVRKWVDTAWIVKYDTIKEIKLPRAQSTTTLYGRPAGAYRGYVDGGHRDSIVANEIDTTKPLYWIEGSFYEANSYLGMLSAEHPKGYTLVYLPMNRVKKFQRDFPQAKTCSERAEALFKTWTDGLSDEDKIILSMHESYGAPSAFEWLDPKRVDDPVLAKYAKLARKDSTKLINERDRFHGLGFYFTVPKFKNPLNAYPLFNRNADQKHTYVYLNAAYAARQKGDL